jgi:hypothetical protein
MRAAVEIEEYVAARTAFLEALKEEQDIQVKAVYAELGYKAYSVFCANYIEKYGRGPCILPQPVAKAYMDTVRATHGH